MRTKKECLGVCFNIHMRAAIDDALVPIIRAKLTLACKPVMHMYSTSTVIINLR
jgi:Tat protein secretion system quality control protein TatD with DNase activity